MKFSRRNLLQGSSAIAIAAAIPRFVGDAKAWVPHGVPIVSTGFNGGVTQTNTSSVVDPGIYYFINWIKNGSANNGGDLNYLNNPTDPTAPTLPIFELDANGYPTSIVTGTGGYFTGFTIPNNSTYSGQWVLKWDGTGTVTPSNFSFTINSGSSTSGRMVFTNNNNATNFTSCFIFITTTSAAPNNVRNLRLCRSADEAALDAGAVWLPEHIALMKSAKPGAIRSLGWGGGFDGTNTALVGLWAQRKSVGFITYGPSVLNPNWCPPGGTGAAITTTSSGSDYTLAYSGFSLTDKIVVQLIWNANPPKANRQSITQVATSGSAIIINWPSNGLAVGNVIVVQSTGGGIPPGMVTSQFYFINNIIDSNNFNISATSGGSSLLATGNLSSTSMFISAVARININSTGFVPVTDFGTPVPNNCTANGNNSPAKGLGTIIYDATTNYFHGAIGGLGVGAPPELFIDYCATVGANPWMTSPFMTQTTGGALGGVTDFMPSWVSYAKNTYPWMKPLIEPYNETWNSGTAAGLGSQYAISLAFALWPAQYSGAPDNGIHDSYGKWVSDLGQAMSAIYGNDRTKYSMLCMGQAGTFSSVPGLNLGDPRLTSNLYVTISGGQSAYKWADRVGCACYYNNPQADYVVGEIQAGFNYFITNAGNPGGQAAIAETFAASANNGINETFTLAWVSNVFTNCKAWGLGLNPGSTVPPAASGNTVKGICAYEGGWGPDEPIASNNWATSVSTAAASITNANPCVLTLNTNSTTSADGGVGSIVGNPGVVGQMINLQFVSGMTQINNSTINCTFTNGSASISATNTLIVNQAIMFLNSAPAPFAQFIPYHVISTGLSGSAFELSATKGGTAITATASGTSNGAQSGWFITAVGTSTITLDLDSTAFGTWTNASTGNVTWTGGGAYSNALRVAAISTNAMGTNNTQMYANHFALSGSGFTAEYPSNFLYFGESGSWSVLQPTILNTTLTPQWNSIVAEN